MRPRRRVKFVILAVATAALLIQPLAADESESSSFRAVLELAGVGPDVLGTLSEGPDYTAENWQMLQEVFNRLKQFRDLQPAAHPEVAFPKAWQSDDGHSIGELFDLKGQIVAVKKLSPPARQIASPALINIYRCRFRFEIDDGAPRTVELLVRRIPKRWQTQREFQEPVLVRGVLVQTRRVEDADRALVLTDHIAWYPTGGAPTGQLLLAKYGMDVALFDEVLHRQPFVRPSISRESDAFYAALKALDQSTSEEIAQLATENVQRAAEKRRSLQPKLREKHLQLEGELAAATDPAARELLARRVKQAKNQRGLAATVVKQAENGMSSAAPMFLQPEAEVGELFVFEGTARRAVRIVAEQRPEIGAYYEVEVFTKDSQNLPVVCCVNRLPEGFPTGDEIREPVRISGIFFKSWRYRSRQLVEATGETTGQRQLYTPVLIGSRPQWLKTKASGDRRLALWGGLAFLGMLATLWIVMTWLARNDRRVRATQRRTETIDLEGPPGAPT